MAPRDGKDRVEEVLDQQAWLMRLARRLGRDEAAAEELAQDSLIAAWTHRPRTPGAMRAWLRCVLVHRVRTDATAERRRREREERAARPERTSGPDEIAERLELARRIAAALDELPEAERSALYLRYYEGLSPPDIARALGAPLGTIKSRLALGRERLRRRLDRDYGERGAWSVLLAPLGAAPFSAPIRPTSPLAPAAASRPVLIGALAMATKTTVALVASAVLGVTLLVWKPWEVRPVAQAVAPEGPLTRHVAEDRALHLATVDADGAESSQRQELPSEPPQGSQLAAATTGTLDISARFASDGAVASGLHGSLEPVYQAWPSNAQPPARPFELDLEGNTVVENVAPGQWRARLNGRTAEGYAGEVFAGQATRLELAIRPGVHVRGHVLDEVEMPVPNAEIFSSSGGDVPGRSTVAITDHAGRFKMRDIAPWGDSSYTALAARARNHLASREWEARGAVGSTVEVVLRLEGQGGSLRGRVVDESAAAIEGAHITFQSGGWSRERGLSPEGLHLDEQPRLELQSDGEGRFETDRLPCDYVVIVVDSPHHAVWRKQVRIQPGAKTELEIVLEAGGSLEGIVLAPSGSPAIGVGVKAGWPGGADGFRWAETDSDGWYRISGLRVGKAEVHARLNFGRELQDDVAILAGQVTRWDVQLPASERAAGLVVDEAANPLVGWGVHVINPRRDSLWLASAVTDSAGRFTLEDCPEGPKALEVRVPDAFSAPPMLIAPFPAGGEEVTLVIPNSKCPTASLLGRVVDAHGVLSGSVEVSLNSVNASWGQRKIVSESSPSFQFESLSAGTYRLFLRATGYVDQSISEIEIVPSQARDVGSIELVRGGLFELTLDPGEWTLEERWSVIQLLTPDGDVVETEHDNELTWRSEQLFPGSWRVTVGGDQIASTEARFEVVAGETTRLTLAIEQGTARHFEVEPLEEGETFTLDVFDSEGKPFAGPVRVFKTQGAAYGLVQGTWRVVARSSSGRSGELEFTIDTLEPTRELLKIALR